MPFVEVWEVDEFSDPEAGADSGALPGRRVVTTLELGPGSSPEQAVEAVATMSGGTERDSRWLRTYWDPTGGRATALFAVDDECDGPAFADGPVTSHVAEVIEIYPSEYE